MIAKKKLRRSFWPENDKDGLGLLQAAAKEALNRAGDKSNFVEEGDLISAGWLYSLRYCKSMENFKKYEYLHCVYHMLQERRLLLVIPPNRKHPISRYSKKRRKSRHQYKCRDKILGFSSLQKFLEYKDFDKHNWLQDISYMDEVKARDMLDFVETCCKNWRELYIVRARAEGESFAKVGYRIGLTGERVRQLLEKVRIRFDKKREGELL